MPVFKIARFAVRPDARDEVERAMREFALYVGLELEDSSWTTYRDRRNPNVYVTLITADDADAAEHQRTAGGSVQFARVLQSRLLTHIEIREYELVATSRGGVPLSLSAQAASAAP
jgi:quinol monooxygenase YgiN